jgi:8-oxo-dGTP diphosphatase / 2-hydroxy-dATP diphosphatase
MIFEFQLQIHNSLSFHISREDKPRQRMSSVDEQRALGAQGEVAHIVKEKDYTLVFCRRVSPNGNEVLLGMKKRGFGMGKWNGFGGKVEMGESIEQAALRELEEECSVVAHSLTRAGYLVFNMLETSSVMRVHVYETWEFENEAVESEEMRPQWFLEDNVPMADMWADDKFWYPLLQAKKKFIGR